MYLLIPYFNVLYDNFEVQEHSSWNKSGWGRYVSPSTWFMRCDTCTCQASLLCKPECTIRDCEDSLLLATSITIHEALMIFLARIQSNDAQGIQVLKPYMTYTTLLLSSEPPHLVLGNITDLPQRSNSLQIQRSKEYSEFIIRVDANSTPS